MLEKLLKKLHLHYKVFIHWLTYIEVCDSTMKLGFNFLLWGKCDKKNWNNKGHIYIKHSQLLNILILQLNYPVLLNQLSIIFQYWSSSTWSVLENILPVGRDLFVTFLWEIDQSSKSNLVFLFFQNCRIFGRCFRLQFTHTCSKKIYINLWYQEKISLW